MATKTDICNLALSHLGSSKTIADFETERSAEANACRQFYDTAREEVLSAFQWPFASKIAALALLAENPTDEWDYSYQYPSDCLHVRRIVSDYRNDAKDSEIKYRIVGDNDGKQIYSDRINAEAEYTVDITNTARFTSDFVMAFSYLLAAYIAPRVTGGNQMNKTQLAMQMYQMKMPRAEARSANEEKRERVTESEFILGR